MALWIQPPTPPTDPGAYAFKIYRNYDGIGGTFGETCRSKPPARISSAKLDAIVKEPGASVGGDQIAAAFPANSITLLIVSPATAAGPKPTVADVTNAASYAHVFAPGLTVVIWGTGLGPEQKSALQLDTNGMVSTSVGSVRILFDGIPAPIVYVTATQCSAVIPYFGATNATTHVQVEYQSVRSDPFEINVTATAPGLFTAAASGQGQGSVVNEDGVTSNSAAAPAHPDSVVILWATGEGLTDPPGVDGRPRWNMPAPRRATCPVCSRSMPVCRKTCNSGIACRCM